MISNSPGSTANFMLMSQKASESGVISNLTVWVSPGFSETFSEPFSSFTGRVDRS